MTCGGGPAGGDRVILGIGSDLLDVARMEGELQAGGAGFRERVFTPAEALYCDAKRYPARHFAARFAAKEALVKALGGGRIALTDVEVLRDGDGPPRILLHGAARARAERAGVKGIFLSLSHTSRLASAHVLLEG